MNHFYRLTILILILISFSSYSFAFDAYITNSKGEKVLVHNILLTCKPYDNYIGFDHKTTDKIFIYTIKKNEKEPTPETIPLENVKSMEFDEGYETIFMDKSIVRVELIDGRKWKIMLGGAETKQITGDKVFTYNKRLNFIGHVVYTGPMALKGRCIYRWSGIIGQTTSNGMKSSYSISKNEIKKIENIKN